MKRIALFVFFVSAALACSRETEEKCAFVPDTRSIKIDLQFESLEDSLPAVTSKSQLVSFFTRHPDIRDFFFNRPAYPSDSTFINRLYNRFSNPHIDTLLMQTHSVFGNDAGLKSQFEQAYANLKFYYPDFQPPKIKTIITGLESDIFANDSLLIVGLDYFLGSGARYKPNMYDYMLRRYNKDFIVPSVMLLAGIDERFNKVDPGDKTVLAEMIAYGKAYYFANQMMPCTPDSVLIGYSAKEIQGSREFESLIWSRLVEDQVLFSTSHLIKQKYIAERPKTIEVGEECPGRIGTWVGWQIVNKFMAGHPDVTLPQLMQMQNASQLFKESGYKPQVVKVPGKEKV